MNTDRIAGILRDRGLVTETQIQQALVRQKSRGGRIGSHLLYYRFVSEAQLVQALSDHHGVPGITLEGREIGEAVFRRLPVEVVDEYSMLPFQYDAATNTLHVAMPDPGG